MAGAQEAEREDGFARGRANSSEVPPEDDVVEEEVAEAAPELDISTLDPRQVNQFKFICDRYMNKDFAAFKSVDGYATLLTSILSNKRSEEIQSELMDLVGDDFELCF